MNTLSRFTYFLTAAATISLSGVQAATIETYSFSSLALQIADGNPSGLSNTQTISGSEITHIQSLTVSIDISGTFNGDLYSYLVHDSGFTVLLNRVGKDAANPFGAASDGLMITFDDLASTNVHDYLSVSNPLPGSPLTGTWQPDGRITDPDQVLDTDPATASLASFGGGNTNGNWTLFVADMSGGESHTLESWSMTITGIPEPSGAALIGVGLIGLMLRRRR